MGVEHCCLMAVSIGKTSRAFWSKEKLESKSASDPEERGLTGSVSRVGAPIAWYPDLDLMVFITVGHPDLDLAIFVLWWNPDGLGAGGLEHYLVGFAFVVLAGYLHGWYLANLVASRLDLYRQGLQFMVCGFYEHLVSASFIVSVDPLPVAGTIVAV